MCHIAYMKKAYRHSNRSVKEEYVFDPRGVVITHVVVSYNRSVQKGQSRSRFSFLIVNLYMANLQLFGSIQTSDNQFGAIFVAIPTNGMIVLQECQGKIPMTIPHCASFVINVVIFLCAGQILATFGV